MAKTLSEDDLAVFRDAVSDAQPLEARDKVSLRKPAKPPLPLQLQRDEERVLQDAMSDHTALADEELWSDTASFLRPGLARNVIRKLRAGTWVVQQELDLHGHNVAAAKQRLTEFLQLALKRGWRCVRVVHGKGLRSQNGEPVLKTKSRAWLAQREEVLAFCEARPADGGSGALVVLLRAPRHHAAHENVEDEDQA